MTVESRPYVKHAKATNFLNYPTGQIIGSIEYETTVCQLIQEPLEEYLYAMEQLNKIIGITTPETLIKSKPAGAAYIQRF